LPEGRGLSRTSLYRAMMPFTILAAVAVVMLGLVGYLISSLFA
jgi:hypothetical protein